MKSGAIWIDRICLPNQTAKPETAATETTRPTLRARIFTVRPIVLIFRILLAPLLPELQSILVRQLAVEHRADLPPKPLAKRTARLNDAEAALSDSNLLFPGAVGVPGVAQLACAVSLVDLSVLLPHPLQQPLRSLWNVVRVAMEDVLAFVFVSTAEHALSTPQHLPTFLSGSRMAQT